MSRGLTTATDVAASLKARNPLIWVVTREEKRVEDLLFRAARAAKYVPLTWDVAQGVATADGGVMQFGSRDPGEMLTTIAARAAQGSERNAWVMRDLPTWLDGLPGATTLRQLRNVVRNIPSNPAESAQAIIVVSTAKKIPDDLAGDVTVVEWPLPDREEIAEILDEALAGVQDDEARTKAAPNGQRDAAIDAAVGLSGEEAMACFARSLVKLKRIDPVVVAAEKKRVVARDGLLTWVDPLPGGLDAVGGLDKFKNWLAERKDSYTPQAKAYGLRPPKGCLLVGVPGGGKSLSAKAIAAAWGFPLIRLDLGAIRSKYVGDSEANLRKVFEIIEALGRCIVWLDEIEKALQGATSDAADGGVAADALGAILTWMQERQGEAFVYVTSNDASKLPPELLRKGRLDEVWYVDLPTPAERVEILRVAMRANNRPTDGIDLARVAITECNGFTGSEIAELVPSAMITGFRDGARPITTDDLVAAAKKVVPLSETAKEKIEELRKWAKGRAQPATSPVAELRRASGGRAIEI